jgi:hypothetical protein
MANKKLNHMVHIMQGGEEAVFRLSDKELKSLQHSSRDRESKSSGNCYNFAMYAFFEYETSRSKYDRFANIFEYHKGDFTWYLE